LARSIDIAAPIEIAWEILCDVDSAPQIFPVITEMERLENSPPGFVVGTKWKETRCYKGKRPLQRIMTITSVQQDLDQYSVSVQIAYPDGHGKIADMHNTATMTMERMDDAECVLVQSMAFVGFGPCADRLIGRFFLNYVGREMDKEMAQLASAIVQRYHRKVDDHWRQMTGRGNRADGLVRSRSL